MHNKYATLKGAALGAAAAAAALLLACVFIRSLGLIAHYAVPGQIETILSQLSGAKVVPPLLPVLVAGAAVGALLDRVSEALPFDRYPFIGGKLRAMRG